MYQALVQAKLILTTDGAAAILQEDETLAVVGVHCTAIRGHHTTTLLLQATPAPQTRPPIVQPHGGLGLKAAGTGVGQTITPTHLYRYS